MLKGYTFKRQLYPTEAHMRLINMLTGGVDGILDIGDKMKVTYNLNKITISSGVAIIQGNMIEEESSTTIDITGMSKDNGTLSLVIEIDLNKENTEEELKQVSYKVLEGRYDYPSLTKDDIVKEKIGVYQYELARFDTSVAGITDMTDVRTYIDQESNPILKGGICCIEKEHKSTELKDTLFKIAYPEGFNKDNTIVIQIMSRYYGYKMNEQWQFGSYYNSNNCITSSLYDDGIQISNSRECDDIRIIIAKKTTIPIVKASEVS